MRGAAMIDPRLACAPGPVGSVLFDQLAGCAQLAPRALFQIPTATWAAFDPPIKTSAPRPVPECVLVRSKTNFTSRLPAPTPAFSIPSAKTEFWKYDATAALVVKV